MVRRFTFRKLVLGLIAALARTPETEGYQMAPQRIAEALGRIAPGGPSEAEAVAALADALGSKSDSAINGAMKALRAFGPAAAPAIPRLRALRTHRYSYVRARAEEALKALGAKP